MRSATQSWSEDTRRIAISLHEEDGMTGVGIAALLKIPKQTVGKWLLLWRTEGIAAPRQRGGYKKCLVTKEGEQVIHALVAEHPDWTGEQFSQGYLERTGVLVRARAMYNQLNRMGYTHKKKSAMLRNRNSPRSNPNGNSTKRR